MSESKELDDLDYQKLARDLDKLERDSFLGNLSMTRLPIPSGWKWRVRCTYNDTVEWPKVPGELAIETRHKDDSSKDMEVLAAERRGDVNVEVTRYTEPY